MFQQLFPSAIFYSSSAIVYIFPHLCCYFPICMHYVNWVCTMQQYIIVKTLSYYYMDHHAHYVHYDKL